jgi:hypothetical protein
MDIIKHFWCFEYFKHFLGLTENEILVNSIVFFAAGYDTTANAITFAVYELARNSSMQLVPFI